MAKQKNKTDNAAFYGSRCETFLLKVIDSKQFATDLTTLEEKEVNFEKVDHEDWMQISEDTYNVILKLYKKGIANF